MRWEWLDRVLLMPRLRAAMDVRAFKRAYTRLYAIACSPEESAQVEVVDGSQIMRLGTGLQHYLDVAGPIPSVRVLCFGASAPLDRVPPVIRHWTAEPFGAGVWLPELRVAIALFEDGNPIRRIVIHELTHALLDLLTDAFPYPLAIAEGFARRAEFLLPDRTGTVEWERQSADRTRKGGEHLDDSQCMSIEDLLLFDAAKHWRQNAAAFVQMTDLSLWLNVYLFKLSVQYPLLKRVLPELRLKNIKTPEGVYSWLQEVSGMDAGALEDGFHRFCITGVVPQEREDA